MNLIKSQLTFTEVMSVVRDIADSCFIQDDEGNDIDYSPASKQASIQVAFIESYTDFEFKVPENEDDKEEVSKVFNENYAEYMSVNIDAFTFTKDGTMFNKLQWDSILQSAEELIGFRKQQILNNKKSSMDEMFDSLTTLISTLNEKAKELDNKKLEKIIKKLNPQEIMKAYQKSGVGDGVRDKAIQDLAKENKELKNQVSARNVKA